jgi:hypothetical protein
MELYHVSVSGHAAGVRFVATTMVHGGWVHYYPINRGMVTC